MKKFKQIFNFSKGSIGSHLQGYVFLLVLITGIFMLYIYIVSEDDQLKQTNLKHLEQTMAVQQLAVENWLQDNSNKIKTLSASRSVREQDSKRMKEEFQVLAKNQQEIHNIAFVNKNGVVEFDTVWEAGSDLSDREYFQESMRGKDSISDVMIGRSSGIPVIMFCSPARNEKDEIYGVIVGVTRLTTINGLLERFRFGDTGETYIVNRSGLMLTESRFTPYLKEKGYVADSTILQYQLSIHVMQSVLDSGVGTALYTDYRGNEVLGAHRQVNHGRWVMMGKIDKKEVLQQSYNQLFFMVFGIFTVIILAFPINWLLTRRLVQPIKKLSKGAAAIQQGNYEYHFSGGDFADSPQELHQLYIVFNEMTTKVQETMKGLQKTNADLIEAEELLRQSHEQLEGRVKERTQELEGLNNELRRSEATNQALLNSIPDLILRVRGDGYCLSEKPSSDDCKISGSFEKNVGRNVSDIFPFEAATRFFQHMKQVLSTGKAQCYEVEMNNLHDIQQFEHRISICGENEVLVMVRDITSEKLAEINMIEARDQLVRVERISTLATIASGIAHEINQPLNAIKVTADSLLFMQQTDSLLAPEEIYQDLARISAQVDRINKIIQHIRSFVHQRHAISFEPVALRTVLAGAHSLLEQQMKRKRIKLILDIPPTLSPIQGNLTSLEEVFVNLLANSMQALDTVNISDKQVVIKAWSEKNLIIEIRDNGPGISEEIKSKVFESFYTTKAGYDGMGLGLSIVKSIIVAHGGKIDVDTSYLGGAAFRIVLPVLNNHVTTGGTSNENSIG